MEEQPNVRLAQLINEDRKVFIYKDLSHIREVPKILEMVSVRNMELIPWLDQLLRGRCGFSMTHRETIFFIIEGELAVVSSSNIDELGMAKVRSFTFIDPNTFKNAELYILPEELQLSDIKTELTEVYTEGDL